ncbi:hypothetical protein QJS10_CPA06g00265 [Acorus calamus]|uniref:Uncharacterized protein n=1 Tax=Acorus calamus TaxID=4465 RepID=A0AAV9ET92_ACOCL|nr:hypothetical protein QJS10_CPA06g00265 [Acorus calamus]
MELRMKEREFLDFQTPQHLSMGSNNWGGASPLLARNILMDPHDTQVRLPLEAWVETYEERRQQQGLGLEGEDGEGEEQVTA